MKMNIWGKEKIVDKWIIPSEKYPEDGAIIPVMVEDIHGNIWNEGVTKCRLIIKKG